jgi:hypothetical protein
MPHPNIISEYLDTLSGELCFDPSLARRVRQEVADHLWETTAELGDESAEAQRRAIANFGNPRDIADGYAAASLFRQTRQVAAVVILVIAAVFVIMKARLAWYGTIQSTLSTDLRDVIDTCILINRYVFRAAIAIGVVGWLYVSSRRVSTSLRPTYEIQLKRSLFLCAATAVPLIASVIFEASLMGLRLFKMGWDVHSMAVPLLLTGVEIVVVRVLVVQLRKAIRNLALASSRYS